MKRKGGQKRKEKGEGRKEREWEGEKKKKKGIESRPRALVCDQSCIALKKSSSIEVYT